MKPNRRFFTPLSSIQIKQLCMLASQAFKVAKMRGAVEDGVSAEEYRKQGQYEAAQVSSLREAKQNHYLAIRGKWFVVIGRLDEAFYDFLNAGDQAEATRQMKWRLTGQVSGLADGIKKNHFHDTQITLDDAECARQAWAYTQALARGKFAGARIEHLDSDQLEQLGFTVVNRTSQKRGVGSAGNRNKSQRYKEPSKPEDADQDEPRQVEFQTPPGQSLMGRVAARLAASRSQC